MFFFSSKYGRATADARDIISMGSGATMPAETPRGVQTRALCKGSARSGAPTNETMEPGGSIGVVLPNESRFGSAAAWGASLYMADNPNQSDRRTPRESNVEEARLRQQAIGVKLRQMFENVVNEPVPDEFLDILRRADNRGSTGGSSSGERD